MDCKKWVTSWLKDAYSMEKGMVESLERQVKDLEKDAHVDMRVTQRVRMHLAQTENQAERVRGLIEGLGEDVSTIKSLTAKVMGTGGAMMASMAEDSPVNAGINDFAAEHMEIASYRALIAAAEHCGMPEVVQVCQDIVREEEAMARSLEQELPLMVTSFFRGEQAKAA